MSDYINKIKKLAAKAYDNSPVAYSVRQLKAWGTAVDPRSSDAQKRAAGDTIVEGVGNGLTGMVMGYTKNGIPHNDSRVVNAALGDVMGRFEGSGITPRVTAVSRGADNNVRTKMVFNDGTRDVGEALRRFTPEGIETMHIKSYLPEGESMGVMPILYPAESQFVKTYGGELGGNFVNRKTSDGFRLSNPNAEVNTLRDGNDKWLGDLMKAKYDGKVDFNR